MQMNHDNKQKNKTLHMVLMEAKKQKKKNKTHTKTRVTEQVSRTSCDKDTIESVEREKNEEVEI